uniref:ShKT domain-containing protein n=1 Tax=Rhabditophanes sp. KR3021 TaxID=114890 RepID=A0AC35U4F5_9BILA
MKILGILLLFLSYSTSIQGTSISNVIDLACKRNPNLSICKNETQPSTTEPPVERIGRKKAVNETVGGNIAFGSQNHKITRTQQAHLRALNSKILALDRNPFVEEGVLRDEEVKPVEDTRSGLRLGGKEDEAAIAEFDRAQEKKTGEKVREKGRIDSETESNTDKDYDSNGGFTKQTSIEPSTSEGGHSHSHGSFETETTDSNFEGGNTEFGSRQTPTEKGLNYYCNKYEENYIYYCRTEAVRATIDKRIIYKFCPSYEANCPVKANEYKKAQATSSTPAVESEVFSVFTGGEGEETPHNLKKVRELKEAIKRFPCTPDCDSSLHKHCTASCKCDYIYPIVQKFCNPPPVPFFLNTCRLWYHGCPKYEKYHYASQYVYSKAEKGKRLPGPSIPPTHNSDETILPTEPVPDPFDTHPSARLSEFTDFARGAKTSRTGPRAETRGAATKRGQFTREMFEQQERDIARVHSNSHRSSTDKPVQGVSRQGHNKKSRARALDSANIAVPQKDVLPMAGEPTGDYHQFDHMTDAHGVAHTARSRSPFTKPGLWEANPDNPHNRDHANKYWYHPESVHADWLNGQATWGAHWAVPAFGVGGTDGFSAVHFPTIGNFLNIPDDYD